MESTTRLFLICLVLACISTYGLVHGKCRGKWAIHSCIGGNKKRTGDDGLSNNGISREKLTLLRELLESRDPFGFVENHGIPQELNSMPIIVDEDRRTDGFPVNDGPRLRPYDDDNIKDSPSIGEVSNSGRLLRRRVLFRKRLQ